MSASAVISGVMGLYSFFNEMEKDYQDTKKHAEIINKIDKSIRHMDGISLKLEDISKLIKTEAEKTRFSTKFQNLNLIVSKYSEMVEYSKNYDIDNLPDDFYTLQTKSNIKDVLSHTHNLLMGEDPFPGDDDLFETLMKIGKRSKNDDKTPREYAAIYIYNLNRLQLSGYAVLLEHLRKSLKEYKSPQKNENYGDDKGHTFGHEADFIEAENNISKIETEIIKTKSDIKETFEKQRKHYQKKFKNSDLEYRKHIHKNSEENPIKLNKYTRNIAESQVTAPEGKVVIGVRFITYEMNVFLGISTRTHMVGVEIDCAEIDSSGRVDKKTIETVKNQAAIDKKGKTFELYNPDAELEEYKVTRTGISGSRHQVYYEFRYRVINNDKGLKYFFTQKTKQTSPQKKGAVRLVTGVRFNKANLEIIFGQENHGISLELQFDSFDTDKMKLCNDRKWERTPPQFTNSFPHFEKSINKERIRISNGVQEIESSKISCKEPTPISDISLRNTGNRMSLEFTTEPLVYFYEKNKIDHSELVE